jgi:hypothetical protein
MIKFRLSLIVVIAASMASSVQAGVIAGWTFENDAVGVNNSPAASIGTGSALSIGMNVYPTPNVGVTTDDVLVGKTSDSGNNGVSDTTNIWRIRGQAGANGAANGWSSAAPIGSQGAQFSASTVGYSSVTVSFDWYATTQGEANLQLQYTTNNGATWTNVALTLGGSDNGLTLMSNSTSANTVIGSYVSDNLLLNSAGGQDWFTGLTATISDPNLINSNGFAIQMVNASTGVDCISTQGTALNNSSGNWRFDNVMITGNTAVPEPSSIIMVSIAGLVGLGVYRSRRRNGLIS